MRIQQLRSQLQGDGLKATLLRGGLGSLGLKVASTALSLLMAVVLARSLGAEGYGVYAYVMALVTLLALPAQAGLPTLVVRETSKAEASHHWGLMRGLWRWSSRVAITLSLILMIIAWAIAWLVSDHFPPEYINTFYYSLALVPLVALGNLRGAALRGLRKVVQGQLPETILRPGLFVLMVVVAYGIFSQDLTPVLAMALHVLAASLAFLVGAWLLFRARPLPLSNSPQTEYQTSAWVRTILPLALISGISLINAQADILMLGLFRNAEEVGVYRVAASAVALIGFGMTAITSVVAPHFARLYAQADMSSLQHVVSRSAQAMLLLALPVFLAFTLTGKPLLTLIFGAEFSAAYLPLAILAMGNLISVAMGSVGALLNMSGHERDTARGTMIAAVANIALNALLIPCWGAIGAATATAGSLAIWNFILWRSAKVKIGISSGVFGHLIK